MALKVRDIYVSAFIAFIAWGFLVSWVPVLKYIGYAFSAGLITSLLGSVSIILLSSRSKRSYAQDPVANASQPAFVKPKEWEEELADLSQSYLYKQESIYPQSFAVSQSFDGLLDAILRDYVSSWYGRISSSGCFVNEIDRAIRVAIIEVKERILNQDIIEATVSRIVPLITRHLKDFYEAERAVRGINLNRTVTESEELDLAIAAKYRDGNLHAAASLKHSDLRLVQQEHIRRIVSRVLPEVLPDTMLKSRTVSVLIKEIVSCAVLSPLLQLLSDPDTWNQLLEAYGRTIIQDRKTVRKLRAALDEHASPPPKPTKPQTIFKLSTGDDERNFERFIRSIRLCNNLSEARRFRSEVSSQLKRESVTEKPDQLFLRRLETGKQMLDQRIGKLSAVGSASGSRMGRAGHNSNQTASHLSNTSLRQVLYDAAGLSYFMEFMDRRRCMTMVQFWIVVDGLRNPLEEESHGIDSTDHSHPSWTDSDLMDLEQISETYLSKPELKIPRESQQAVHTFLKTGSNGTTTQYAKARAAILKAQSAIFHEMEEVHFPDFKKSDLFYKYLTADDSSLKAPVRPSARAVKQPSVAPIPESPSRPHLIRSSSAFDSTGAKLRRNASSSNDLKFSARTNDRGSASRRSLDIDTSAPLFDDDIDDDRLARSTHSFDNESMSEDHGLDNQDQIVNAMETALTNIMTDETKMEETKPSIFDAPEGPTLDTRYLDSPRSSGEYKRVDTFSIAEKDKANGERPNIASLGLVNTSSRIGVFSDNDLFGDEEKFLEDEQTDPEGSADEKSIDEEIHQAAPGDLGLAEAIAALTSDIDKLAAQDSVIDTLTRKAELTNNVAELRILGKSKSSLQREIRRKELQRQQYIVQESDNSLYGRADVRIKSIMVGREQDGQEFALYVIEVQRQAGDNMPAASWAVARRYSEFHDLHRRLRHLYPAVRQIDFPRRGLVLKMQREFLHKRRLALEDYMRQLLQLPAVCRSRGLRAFLSQSAILNQQELTREGERRDIVSRIYNSVTDGMDEFLGNVPVLDQLSVAGQNLISAATSQFNVMSTTANTTPSIGTAATTLPIAPEDPIQSVEARAELLVYEPNATPSTRADQLEPFVKPICDLFLETFNLQRGNNWLRGRAVVVVLHQLLGGTVERKVRESVKSFFAEPAMLRYVTLLKDNMWPDGQLRKEIPVRMAAEKSRTKMEASVTLATLLPDLAGNVVGRANAQAASRRLSATTNNGRLNTHLAFVILDEIIDILFPPFQSR